MSHILLMWSQGALLSQDQILPLQGLLHSRQGRYKAQVLPHQGLLHARQARYRAKFCHSRAFCTPGRKDRQPEMTLPRPMGRSTPSPAGARTEHRSPRVLPPLRACFPSMPKWPDGACQLADCHRCIPDCHTPHRKNDVPSKAVGVKHDGRRRLHCTTLSLLSDFCCFFVFSNTAKVEAVAAQVLNKITSDIPYRHPASRSTHSRNTSSTCLFF